MELVGRLAANVTRVSLHGVRLESAPRKNARIRVKHPLVALICRVHRHIEGVGIFHHKFFRAHQPKTRTYLIPELPLELIDDKRQLAIGVHKPLHNIRRRLFRRRTHRVAVLSAIFKTEHPRSHRLPAPRLLPKFGGLQNRHRYLKSTRAVHFLTDNPRHFRKHALPERQVGIESPCELTHKPSTHKELVRINFGILRIVPQRLY